MSDTAPSAAANPDPARSGTASPSAGPPRTAPARRAGAVSLACAVVAGLLLPLATLAVWARTQLLDTDRYVETVAPLATEPAVQAALTDRLTDAVVQVADIESLAADLLPERARPLAPMVAAGAETLVRDAATHVVESDEFAQLWAGANTAAHAAATALLTGSDSAVASTEAGRVVIHLAPVVERILTRLDERLGTDLRGRVPTDRLDVQYVLVDSPDLARLQTLVRWFHALAWVLVLSAVASLAATVLTARDRRVGLGRAGWAVLVSMLALAAALAVARTAYLGNLPSAVQSADAAAATFDALVRFLRRTVWVLAAAGAVTVCAAWLAGPSAGARRFRSWAPVGGG